MPPGARGSKGTVRQSLRCFVGATACPRRRTRGTMSAEDDPLARPLNLGGPRLPRYLIAVLLLTLPLILLLLPLLLFGVFTALFAAALWAAVRQPAMLRGVPRDIRFVVRLVRATKQLKQRLARTSGTFTTADYFAETVAAHGHREALIFEGMTYTYSEVDRESDRVARWAMEQGIAPHDSVALICANRPEHLFLWLGLAKVGAATTLINSALRGASLGHALSQCKVRIVLFDGASAAALAPLASDGSTYRFVCIDAEQTPAFASALQLPVDVEPPPPSLRASCRSTDTLFHIFTSGTTGLPKAARLNHIRFFSAIVVPHMFSLRPSDRFYCCLPMCHTAAVGALSICWWLGAPMILAPKFSASRFWQDCVEQRATVVQYVGELCRYLVHSPPTPFDKAHGVRVAFGNGLRPEVWPRFVSRFGVPQIAEVYASTEGNANLANTEGKEGAVGFISPLLARMYPVRIVRIASSDADAEGVAEGGGSGEVLRGADGRCVLCQPGEVGELLGLVDQSDASRNFAGYTDAHATRRKLVRDVLKAGDCWFRTGDLVRTDTDGFVYFADRMGDTFRYKGENVSTAEVSAAIGALPGLRMQHCLVYGVRVPHVDGRVGMAALLPEEGAPPPSMRELFEGLDAQLPHYAQPRFVRLLTSAASIELTLTFKPKRQLLVAQGFEPAPSGTVFIRDAQDRTYVPLDDAKRRGLMEGTLALH